MVISMRPTLLFFTLLASACITLSPPMPAVTAENPNLLSNGNPTDPTRQQQQVGRPCVYACKEGYACNPHSGVCEPLSHTTEVDRPDGGPAWLP